MICSKNFTWEKFFTNEKKKKYFVDLIKKIKNIRTINIVYPEKKLVFNAFIMTKFQNIKVVLLGQDPYFNANQAHGLSFSVPKGIKIPLSLRNIFIELENDYAKKTKNFHGCLEPWAKQGVFLLNTILTVSKGYPCSHQGIGWEIFTDTVIKYINFLHKDVIFLLWGNMAIKKKCLINTSKHLILSASHPSPLSAYRSFLGCKHFSKTNIFLKNSNQNSINWFKNMYFNVND